MKELNCVLNFITPFESDQPLPRNLIGDPERFKQVAINIIQNAIDASH
jgi:signal transduction histidine kinase